MIGLDEATPGRDEALLRHVGREPEQLQQRSGLLRAFADGDLRRADARPVAWLRPLLGHLQPPAQVAHDLGVRRTLPPGAREPLLVELAEETFEPEREV